MTVATFIPELWAGRLLASLKKSLVFAQAGVVNRDYEGDISEAGDTVHINNVTTPTIAAYTNTTTVTPALATTAEVTLLINQARYFAFKVDDVDERQAAGNVIGETLVQAAYGLRDVADQYVSALYTGAIAANRLGTVSITNGNLAYTNLIALAVLLDNANVPQEGRWVIVPPWYHGLLLDNTKFVSTGSVASDQRLRNGQIGEAAGFTVLKSNNSVNVTGDDWSVMAGHPSAITYAEAINDVEAYRPESSFADAVKGLHLYGAKLVRTSAIATVVASIT